MPVNHYFQSGVPIGRQSEQRLVEDLVIETIKIHGHSLYYIPRTVIKHDQLFGEDVLSQYKHAIEIEMYLSNTEGWEGDKDMFSKFGIQIKDKATFLVSKRRWEDTVNHKGLPLQLPNRPAEGDLIYFPITDSMFEIKFVKADDTFYQLGKYYVFTLECELFQYSSEVIETGLSEIDDTFGIRTSDQMDYKILLQNGDALLYQNGTAVANQAFDLRLNSPLSDNDVVQSEADDILDFSVINPFGEI